MQLAAGFVGLGLPSLGTLVSVLLGIRLDKSEQLADWSKRPLSEATRHYAAADVEHLFPLTIELQHRLQDMGRETWAVSECEVLRTTADRRVDPDGRVVEDQGRVVDARREGARRAVRRRVARARAQRLDVLPAFVLPDLALAAVVGRPPKTRDQLFAFARRQPVAQRRGARAARRGRGRTRAAQGPAAAPREVRRRPRARRRGRAARGLRRRARRAERVEKQLLATRDDVKALVYGRPSRLDAGWRAQIAGDQLHRLLDGQAVIRLTDRGRHLRLED